MEVISSFISFIFDNKENIMFILYFLFMGIALGIVSNINDWVASFVRFRYSKILLEKEFEDIQRYLDYLDSLIQSEFDSYCVAHFNYKEASDIAINNDRETQMNKDVTKNVIELLSPDFVNVLALVINTQELTKFITNKVMILSTAYILSVEKEAMNTKK